MEELNKKVYFETSAINYLTDKPGWDQFVKTNDFQTDKGNILYISPVVIAEILMTSDERRRENLIILCQHIFYNKLINSPAEIIVNYISAGCPLKEEKYDFHSNGLFANTWEEICKNKLKTFVYDYAQLKERIGLLKMPSKSLQRIAEGIISSNSNEGDSISKVVDFIFEEFINKVETLDKETAKITKMTVFFAVFFLCMEIDIDNTPYKLFWKARGIDAMHERIIYLFKEHRNLFFRGPIFSMAATAYYQLSNGAKSNRGLIMDCFHAIYITYTDVFMTVDKHFLILRASQMHSNFSRILDMKEIEKGTIRVI